jgi:hypothetical protein
MSALIQLFIAFITRKVVNVVKIVRVLGALLPLLGVSSIHAENHYLSSAKTYPTLPMVPLKPEVVFVSIPSDGLDFRFVESTTIQLPLTERYGLEYSVAHFQNYSDLSALSITSSEDDSKKSANRYSYPQPLVFRVTLKGYSLFQSENGRAHYFDFERAKERELRKPNVLISITKHF